MLTDIIVAYQSRHIISLVLTQFAVFKSSAEQVLIQSITTLNITEKYMNCSTNIDKILNRKRSFCKVIIPVHSAAFFSIFDAISIFKMNGSRFIHQIIETNSSFHVKQHTTGKVQFLFLMKFFSNTYILIWEKEISTGQQFYVDYLKFTPCCLLF